jgi:hypothetical protein
VTLSTKFESLVSSRSKGTCPECGEVDPAAMTSLGICYECLCRRAGRSTTENHHVFGQDDPLTTGVPGNFHRGVNVRQAARQPLLKQRSEDPLVEAARLFTTIAELAEVGADRAPRAGWEWLSELLRIIANASRSAADRLLALYGRLVEEHGPDWHRERRPPSSWT